MGFSAGANLALLAAYGMGDTRLLPSCHPAEVKIRSVINFYGPTDMTSFYRTTIASNRKAMDAYIGGAPFEFPDRYKILSPISHINMQTPPTITLQGAISSLVLLEKRFHLSSASRHLKTAAYVTREKPVFPG